MIAVWKHTHLLPLTILTLTVLALLTPSDAAAFQRSVARTGANGNTATKNIVATRTENGYSRDVQATGPRGNQATRSAQGQWDAESKTWSRQATSTGPKGNTVTGSTTTARTSNGYARNTTVAGPQGNTASRSAQGQWDPVTKTWSKTVTTSGGN